jgi:glycerol-3-phosphate dehydrogenase (NAD(P)+)
VQTIAVLGAGSWGTALALHLSRQGFTVNLWSYESEHIAAMQRDRANARYLPSYAFPDALHPVANLEEALQEVNYILIAVPSVGFKEVLTQLKPLLQSHMRIVWATKGLDDVTGELLHQVALQVLGNQYPYAILSGPSFAKEVASALPTAVVVASNQMDFAKDLQQIFNGPFFRVYLCSDMIGVEVGGVVKNVLAIATGISDGMGFGANARAALITRGLAEMIRLGMALGGLYETFTGLTGLGDLVLTCTDDQSRNRRFGLLLGQGHSAKEAVIKIGQVVEGKRNAELVAKLAKKYGVEMPIVEMVLAVLQSHMTPQDAMQKLLARIPKAE